MAALDGACPGGVTSSPTEQSFPPAASSRCRRCRDERVFDRPDRFDIGRSDQMRMHAVFGYCVHRCIGEALARAELEKALQRSPRASPVCSLMCRRRYQAISAFAALAPCGCPGSREARHSIEAVCRDGLRSTKGSGVAPFTRSATKTGAGGGTRTHTTLPSRDFKSSSA